jgi:hypothetical protein
MGSHAVRKTRRTATAAKRLTLCIGFRERIEPESYSGLDALAGTMR